MKLLQNLSGLNEGKDMTELPHDVVSEIQKNIRNGAKDLEQNWMNALHLVHKAYEIEGVQRPDPSMAAGWKQYESNIEYAVQQLAKYRSLDADWRISASMFTEAMSRKITYRVSSQGANSAEHYTVKAANLDDVIDTIKAGNKLLMDITVNKSADNHSATLIFSKWGIKQNYSLRIEPAFKH